LWTESIIWNQSNNNTIKIFFNKQFSDDYFFNRIHCDKENDIFKAIKFLKEFLTLNEIPGYLYLKTEAEDLRNQCKTNSVNWIDSIYTLESSPIESKSFTSMNLNKEITVIKINDPLLINKWVAIFCQSFNIKDRLPFIEILNKNREKFIFLLAILRENDNDDDYNIPVGGCLLFEKWDCLGLYCLGTSPEFRNKGIAKMIINTSLKIAHTMKHEKIFLHTFQNTNYIEIYKKFDFKVIDKRKIFQIN
jgi:hypothetical protein